MILQLLSILQLIIKKIFIYQTYFLFWSPDKKKEKEKDFFWYSLGQLNV